MNCVAKCGSTWEQAFVKALLKMYHLRSLSGLLTDLSAERCISKSHQRRNPHDRVVEL